MTTERSMTPAPMRRGMLWASIVCLLCIALPSAGCGTTEHSVRVMTYNIHHGADAEERATLDEMANLIEDLGVDVVGLQEVDRHWSARSDYADQVVELAERLDMHFAFGPIYDLPTEEEGRPRRKYGLAILSRFPIVESQNYELTRLTSITSEPELRRLPGFLTVTTDVDGTALHIFNTHLDYRPDPGVRRQQVDEMLEILSGVEGPLVLMGDFNALPDADELAPLQETFVDAWQTTAEGNTYPADVPEKRIDFIFVTPEISVDSTAVPVATASDHRPVIADLKVRRRGSGR